MGNALVNQPKSPNGTKPVSATISPLLNGDHLTLPEFEQRYSAMLPPKRAELIEGIVVMSPPISNAHGEANVTLAYYLKRYARATPGVACGLNTSVRLDRRNEYQPDILLRVDSGKLARSKATTDGLLEGSPELMVEIAMNSASYDLHEKKAVYTRNSVPEYIVWRLGDARIQWFALERGEYIELKRHQDGAIRSRAFPGLWINVSALLAGDEEKVEHSLQKGLASAEHAALVKTLRGTDKRAM